MTQDKKSLSLEELKHIREVEKYKGPIDQDGNKVPDLDKWIADQKKSAGWS